MCYNVCNQNMEPDEFWGSKLRISLAVPSSHIDMLYNPLIESGLIYCRVFLEFLGIKQDGKTYELIENTEPRRDDIFITDFGLPELKKSEAVSGFAYASGAEVEAALCSVIENGHKSVAHLTSGPKLSATYPSLKLACRVVSDLVHRHLYVPLGEIPLVPMIENR